jgi:phage RecT family recombinase
VAETKTVAAPKQAPLSNRQLVRSDKFVQEMQLAMPRTFSAQRLARIVLTAMTRTPLLEKCDQSSLARCLLDLAQLGLEPDGRHAHLIPFKNTKRNTYECQLIIDYKGYVQLVFRSGMIQSIHADVIYEGDDFAYDRGVVQRHTKWEWRTASERPKMRGNLLGAYASVRIIGGAEAHVALSKDEVDAIRRRSKSANNGPWVTDYNEMAKKGLALDTPIPTADGWKEMGDLGVGDQVFDVEGKQCSVVAVSEIKQLQCYRVTFANGEHIVCDDEHRWVARIGTTGECNIKKRRWPVVTINEMFDAKAEGKPVVIPVAGPLETEEVDLPIDPWLLGYWLGNGSRGGAVVHTHGEDASHVMQMIEERTPFAVGAINQKGDSNCKSIGIPGGLKVRLREIGSLQDKSVPTLYMRASATQRLALLQGLMDSDGHVCKSRGRAIFGSTTKGLADCVAELASSLGNVVHRSQRMCSGFGTSVLCYIVGWQPVQPPVTSPRKLANYRPRKIGAYRAVKSIEKIPTVPTRCIAVDSPTRTYLAGRCMTPTHNTAFKRLVKWLPISTEIRKALEVDDEEDTPNLRSQNAIILGDIVTGESLVDDENTIDATAEDVTPAWQRDLDEVRILVGSAAKPDDILDIEQVWLERHSDAQWRAEFAELLSARMAQLEGK